MCVHVDVCLYLTTLPLEWHKLIDVKHKYNIL